MIQTQILCNFLWKISSQKGFQRVTTWYRRFLISQRISTRHYAKHNTLFHQVEIGPHECGDSESSWAHYFSLFSVGWNVHLEWPYLWYPLNTVRNSTNDLDVTLVWLNWHNSKNPHSDCSTRGKTKVDKITMPSQIKHVAVVSQIQSKSIWLSKRHAVITSSALHLPTRFDWVCFTFALVEKVAQVS